MCQNLSFIGVTILSLLATDPEMAETISDMVIEQKNTEQPHEHTREYGRNIEVVHHGR